MRSFLYKLIIAFVLLSLILLAGLLFAPGKQDTVVYAVPDKNRLLAETPSPRIIFVGGSNLPFSLNSKRIEEEFRMPVVNMGIHAGLGLLFMLKDVDPYIQKGDIIVVVPEYDHYFNSVYYGDMALVSTIVDAYPEGFKYLISKQIRLLFPKALKYAGMKLQQLPERGFDKLMGRKLPPEDFYNRFSYNRYGDVETHWGMDNKPFAPQTEGKGEAINPEVIENLASFKEVVKKKGATFILLPPVFQASSYDYAKPIIDAVKEDPIIRSLNPDFEPVRYRFPDSLFFDSPYHTNKQGVELRTTYIIEDLNRIIKNGSK